MTATTTTTTSRKPIRGFLYGIVLGLGLTLIVVGQGVAALGTWPPFLVLIGGIVLGVVWSTYGPAKAPKDPPPNTAPVLDEPSPLPAPTTDAAARPGPSTKADEATPDDA